MQVNLKSAYVAVVAVVAMTACGGSADDGAGQLSEFQVSPTEVAWKTTLTTCPLIKTGEYTVIGGTAPYTVFSPYDPDPADPLSLGVTFSAPGGTTPTHSGSYTVPNRNGRFAIYVQGCFDPAVVTVLDDLKRVAAIKVSYTASGTN
jgi:hypothetical protein